MTGHDEFVVYDSTRIYLDYEIGYIVNGAEAITPYQALFNRYDCARGPTFV